MGRIYILTLFAIFNWLLSFSQQIEFSEPVHYSTSINISLNDILLRDFDGDGFIDMVCDLIGIGGGLVEGTHFGVLVNKGDGTFQNEVLIPKINGDIVWDINDLNKDEHPDVLYSNYWTNSVSVSFGLGDYELTDATNSKSATHGGPSSIYDINRDTNNDIITMPHGSGVQNNLIVFPGNGDGSFQEKRSTPQGGDSCIELIIADLDQNGLSDIISRNATTYYTRFMQNEPDIFTIEFEELPQVGTLFDIQDINHDQIPDFVAAFEQGLIVRAGTGNGTFSQDPVEINTTLLKSSSIPAFIGDLILADMNDDNNMDIIYCNGQSNKIYILEGNGDFTFNAPVIITTSLIVNRISVADINDDNIPDLVTTNEDNSIYVIKNLYEFPLSLEIQNESATIWPNPTSNELNLDIRNNIRMPLNLKITDSSGKMLYDKQYNQVPLRLSATHLKPGAYLLQLKSKNFNRTFQFIKSGN